MPRAVDVHILGQKITLRSDDEEEYIRRVAQYVDGKMREVGESMASMNKYSVAIFVALNIADEYHRLKEDCEAASTRMDRLLERLTAALSEDV